MLMSHFSCALAHSCQQPFTGRATTHRVTLAAIQRSIELSIPCPLSEANGGPAGAGVVVMVVVVVVGAAVVLVVVGARAVPPTHTQSSSDELSAADVLS